MVHLLNCYFELFVNIFNSLDFIEISSLLDDIKFISIVLGENEIGNTILKTLALTIKENGFPILTPVRSKRELPEIRNHFFHLRIMFII